MHFEWEQLATGVHRCRLPFLDVTVGMVTGASAVLLIDCGTTLSEAARIAEDVRRLTGRMVTHIVLTHHHFDHILGSAGFPDAQLYAAAPVAVALTAGIGGVRDDAVGYGADGDEIVATAAAVRVPDHLVTDIDLDLGGRVVTVAHLGRGHTDHDLVVVVPPAGPADPRVVFCGDLVEESGDPAIGADSDIAAWPGTLERLLSLGGPDARYVPGHGTVVDAHFVARQRDWLSGATGPEDGGGMMGQ